MKTYILLDEIQNVTGWQQAVNDIQDRLDCDIVITLSSTVTLSGSLANEYVELQLFPLSFREFFMGKKTNDNLYQVNTAFREYEHFGGFPVVALADDFVKDQLLQGIYDAILLNDISIHGSIRDPRVLRLLIEYLTGHSGEPIQPTLISRVFKKLFIEVSPHTISRYLVLLENAFLFYQIPQYNVRTKQYLPTASEYSLVDPGLYSLGGRHSSAQQLETIVLTELLRRGYQLAAAKLDNRVAGFVAREKNKVMDVQTAESTAEIIEKTEELLRMKDDHQKVVITRQSGEFDSVTGILIVNIVDWLLHDVSE